jgi:hypothetical protein
MNPSKKLVEKNLSSSLIMEGINLYEKTLLVNKMLNMVQMSI